VRTTNPPQMTGCNAGYELWIERQAVSHIYMPIVVRNHSTSAATGQNTVIYPMGIISHTCPDGYEPDDTWQLARAIEPGVVQVHSFDSNPAFYAADKDVLHFDISAGRTITFTVAAVTNTQTLLELYDVQGVALDVTGTTGLAWTPTIGGRYYLSVRPLTTTFGCADTVGYDLLAETSAPRMVYLPLVTREW
jgi:hypothetical protein